MPGPIIRDTTPEWLKPQNASVLDSPLVKAVRALATITGMNDPQQAVFSAMAPTPMIGLVPREPVAQIVGRLAKDAPIEGGAMPEAVKRAIVYLSERYPRIMSHVGSVSARPSLDELSLQPRGSVLGSYESFDAARRGAVGVKPTSRIGGVKVAPAAIESAHADPHNVLAHEVGHAVQDLSQTDRAWRSGERTFKQEYGRLHDMAGYERNPYERQARRIGERQANNAYVMREIRRNLDAGMTPEAVVERMNRLHGTTLLLGGIKGDNSQRDLRRLVNIAQTMMARAKE